MWNPRDTVIKVADQRNEPCVIGESQESYTTEASGGETEEDGVI
jgi:hypothetical protein